MKFLSTICVGLLVEFHTENYYNLIKTFIYTQIGETEVNDCFCFQLEIIEFFSLVYNFEHFS